MLTLLTPPPWEGANHQVRVSINCDLGEGFGRWTLTDEASLIPLITDANIACGMHAGDPSIMAETVQLAVKHGVGIGAHPSYPDLQGFGRRWMNLSPQEVRDLVTYQIGALQAFATAFQGRLSHVKAHGALYNRAADDAETAQAVVEGIQRVDPGLVVVVPSGSVFEQTARAMGAPVVCEVFADRGYDARGRLVPRHSPGAILHDPHEVAQRAWQMVSQGRVQAVTGEWVPVRADTLCLHGDHPQAVPLARHLRAYLLQQGVELVPIARLR